MDFFQLLEPYAVNIWHDRKWKYTGMWCDSSCPEVQLGDWGGTSHNDKVNPGIKMEPM